MDVSTPCFVERSFCITEKTAAIKQTTLLSMAIHKQRPILHIIMTDTLPFFFFFNKRQSRILLYLFFYFIKGNQEFHFMFHLVKNLNEQPLLTLLLKKKYQEQQNQKEISYLMRLSDVCRLTHTSCFKWSPHPQTKKYQSEKSYSRYTQIHIIQRSFQWKFHTQ